jgi:predicted aspartyl protease
MGEEVLAGTFFLNEHPIIILFDSGASHDFISSTYAKKAMLSTVTTEALYVISTPGCRVDADRIVRKAPLELPGRVFNTDLITLKGQGIDVILGMSWMNVIPRSEIVETKPPYVCPRCFIHTYSNNMINRFHVQ